MLLGSGRVGAWFMKGRVALGTVHLVNVERRYDFAVPDIVQHYKNLICKDALQRLCCFSH